MKTLRYLVYSIVATLVVVTSCQKVTTEGEPVGPTENVRIALSAPSPITKSIGDGTNATVAYYTAFVDGRVVTSLSNQVDLDANGRAVLDLKLVKNVTYRFVFWAHTPGKTYYDLSTFYTDSKVKVDYQTDANDDLRDAFCAAQDVTVTGEMDVTIYLKRPFAQINFCSSDYENVKYLGLHDGMLSSMTVLGLPDTITVLDGSVSSSNNTSVDVAFGKAAIPSGEDEYITVKGVQYGYIGMNYVLAPIDGDTVEVKGSFENGNATWETDPIPSVPVKANYKTNILGECFVEHGKFTIVILPEFETPDEEVILQ